MALRSKITVGKDGTNASGSPQKREKVRSLQSPISRSTSRSELLLGQKNHYLFLGIPDFFPITKRGND